MHILLLLCLVLNNNCEMEKQFDAFKKQFGKSYNDNMEEMRRFEIFADNVELIDEHNKKYEQNLVTFRMATNQFADLRPNEYRAMNKLLSSKSRVAPKNSTEGIAYIDAPHIDYANEVDWRKAGAVTPIKDQGRCGSCWAFSTTGVLEGQEFRKTAKLISLSEQNLVDCSSSFGNEGCDGGLMENAYDYIKANHGIDTEQSYPYEGHDDRCRFEKNNVGATDRGYVEVAKGNEIELMHAVATQGPISVAIDASNPSFQFYASGIYYEKYCSTQELDHAVLVVGYGSDQSGHDYWIVKNSWGTSWGEKGYIKMARNRNNNCGVATMATYPLI